MTTVTVKTKDNQKDAFEIRKSVFVEEQGYENEFDDIDNTCDYVTVYYDGRTVGTGRLFPDPAEPGTYIFGRIAVLKEYRKKHLGAVIVSSLEDLAKEKGGKKAVLCSQESASGFYQKCGFRLKDGKIVYDEGHLHLWMEKFFQKKLK